MARSIRNPGRQMYGERMFAKRIIAEDNDIAVRDQLDSMAIDVLRRAATLDRLAGEIELAALHLDERTRDLEMREDDLIKASLEMRERRGAFRGTGH